MGRRCTICDHPKRQEIDKALLSGLSFRKIGKRFDVNPSSAYRHRQTHVVDLIARAQNSLGREELVRAGKLEELARAGKLVEHQQETEAGELRYAIDVVQQLKAINAACLEVLKQARSDRKYSLSLRAVDRIVRQIELQAKLLGQIQDGPTVNVAVLPEWHGIRRLVADALQPYPEARVAVAGALQDASL